MKENIILIMADQFRGDALGISGNRHCITPNLDGLAGSGCYFKRGYSPSPTCVPARACMVTGKKASRTGFFSNDFSVEWNYARTLMETVRDAGYQTINVGKNHFHPMRKNLGFEVNDLYEVADDENHLPSDYHLWLKEQCGGLVSDTAKLYDANAWTVEPWTENPRLHPTEWTADTAIQRLERRDPTRPFYLQVSFQRPHPPLDPPVHILDRYLNIDIPDPPVGDWAPEFDQDTLCIHPFEGRINKGALKYARKAYYASITHIDAQVGKLIYWLRRNGLWDNTTVFFIADHGEMLGDHNMFRKGPPYEGSARIPFIVKFSKDACQPAGKRFDFPVSLLDLFPTCALLAGAETPEDLDGIALQKLIADPDQRKYVFGENYRDNKLVTTGGAFVAGSRYKYVWDSWKGKEQLFDLQNDPEELHDISGGKDIQNVFLEMKRVVIDEYQTRPYDQMLDESGSLRGGRVLPAYRPPR